MQGRRGKFLKQTWAHGRIKLYLKGIKPPPLGSVQDRVLRAAVFHEIKTEVAKEKLHVLSRQFTLSGSKEDWNRMSQGLSEYIKLAFNLELDYEKQEQALREEFSELQEKDVRFKITEKGIVISGLSDWT